MKPLANGTFLVDDAAAPGSALEIHEIARYYHTKNEQQNRIV
jgi:hypothetical protein